MKVKSTNSKTFQLIKNQTILGEIIYQNLFYPKAEIHLNETQYKIAPVGLFGKSISVTKNNNPIASLYLSWSGTIVMAFQDGEEFIVKSSGMFSNTYTVENQNKEKLVQLEAKFNLSELHYAYSINQNSLHRENTLFLLLAVYSANFFIATMSGANSGMI